MNPNTIATVISNNADCGDPGASEYARGYRIGWTHAAEAIAYDFADGFKIGNPNFNIEKFIAACKLRADKKMHIAQLEITERTNAYFNARHDWKAGEGPHPG